MSEALSKESLLYQRLYISAEDLRLADGFAHYLLKKGWHFAPWERRWSTYVQQAAFTSSFITAYARPFTRSAGWPAFPARLMQYTGEESQFHQHLLSLRHQVYAHSDSSRHYVRPMRIVESPSAIVGSPFLRLSEAELQLAVGMIGKLLILVKQELEQLMCIIEAEPNSSYMDSPQRQGN